MNRDMNWVEHQLAAIFTRLGDELTQYPGDENKAVRHQIYQERGIVENALSDIRLKHK